MKGMQMLLATKSKVIAALTAASLAFTAMPALAWGKKEQGFVAGVATAVIVDQLIKGGNHRAGAGPRYEEPRYVERGYSEPRYSEPRYVEQRYVAPRNDDRRYYVEPRRASVSVSSTPAAQAFRSYSLGERKAIQRELRRAGYYNGGIDGVFGAGTYNAVAGYARDSGASRNLQTTGGVFSIYDGLLF